MEEEDKKCYVHGDLLENLQDDLRSLKDKLLWKYLSRLVLKDK